MLAHIKGAKLPAPPWRAFSLDLVLQYYDGPRLLLQRSLAGQLFLAWWSDSDERADRWVYLPVSESRLHDILSGRVTDLDALRNPEDGCLFVVDVDLDTDAVVQTVVTDTTALPEDALPAAGVRLNIPVPKEISGVLVG